ncbi:MAG: hypothetical protein ACXW1U_14255 [Methylobacter sp.]
MANVKQVLSEYVQDQSKWFYWYHNPKRLKAIHDLPEDSKKEKMLLSLNPVKTTMELKRIYLVFLKQYWMKYA